MADKNHTDLNTHDYRNHLEQMVDGKFFGYSFELSTFFFWSNSRLLITKSNPNGRKDA